MARKVFGDGSFADVEKQIKRGKQKKPFPDYDDALQTARREVPSKRRR